MHLEFSPAAEADPVQIAAFIARDNVSGAVTFVEELEANLSTFPSSGARALTSVLDCAPGRTAAM